jgi:hypothetical protein
MRTNQCFSCACVYNTKHTQDCFSCIAIKNKKINMTKEKNKNTRQGRGEGKMTYLISRATVVQCGLKVSVSSRLEEKHQLLRKKNEN